MTRVDITGSERDGKFLARFAIYLTTLVGLYVGGVTFVPLSPTGIKYADIAVPLLLGTVIGGLVGFWYGGALKSNHPPTPDAPPVSTDQPAP